MGISCMGTSCIYRMYPPKGGGVCFMGGYISNMPKWACTTHKYHVHKNGYMKSYSLWSLKLATLFVT